MRRGLSLTEVIIAIIILAMIAALAMPRRSQAAATNPEATLREQLRVLRVAIERFRQDHNGLLPGGVDCAADLVVRQLCGRTDATGRPVDGNEGNGLFGPYLRAIPRSAMRNSADTTMPLVTDDQPADWHFDCRTGYIRAQVPGVDAHGTRYADY